MRVGAMGVRVKGAELEPFEYDTGELGEHECLLKVLACGLCAADIALMGSGSRFPMVPGHEVVAEVLEVGRAVRGLEPGARVGVGWQSGACFECADCLAGRENLCDRARALISAGFGGFADHVQVDARFAFEIPAGIDSTHAGPLLCAGAAVHGALRHAGMTTGQRVGVVGVGGLGHLGVQFAARLGNEVVAFTGSADKAELATRLGARDAVLVPRGGKVPGPARRLAVILVTSPEPLDWGSLLDQLDTDGTLVTVATAKAPLELPAKKLLNKRRRVMGSLIGSRAEIVEMLQDADRHGVRPVVETFPLARARDAVARVRENLVRYRAVVLP